MLALVPFMCLLQCLMYLQMDLPNLFKKLLHFQCFSCDVFLDSSLLSIDNIQGWRWKIPKESFKKGLASRIMDCYVVRVLNVDNIFILCVLMLLIVTPQMLYQSPIDYLYFPIYLWIECCISIQHHVYILPKCILKVWLIFCWEQNEGRDIIRKHTKILQ